jgi:hypothetical protein
MNERATQRELLTHNTLSLTHTHTTTGKAGGGGYTRATIQPAATVRTLQRRANKKTASVPISLSRLHLTRPQTQQQDAFDAGKYSFFGEMEELDGGLEGALEVRACVRARGLAAAAPRACGWRRRRRRSRLPPPGHHAAAVSGVRVLATDACMHH